jgi:hypothetical protein
MDVLAEIRKAIELKFIDTRQAIDNCVFTHHYNIIIIIIIITIIMLLTPLWRHFRF